MLELFQMHFQLFALDHAPLCVWCNYIAMHSHIKTSLSTIVWITSKNMAFHFLHLHNTIYNTPYLKYQLKNSGYAVIITFNH